MQKWLDDNDISMYSAHSEGKSVVAKTLIKILVYLNYLNFIYLKY